MLQESIGNTPLIKLHSYKRNNAYIKIEGSNLYGSAKDRAASYVLHHLLEQGTINQDTEVIESSSGNMGVALAAVGARLGIKVTIVIDNSISQLNEFLIQSYRAQTIKIMEADENGSYLKNRLAAIDSYLKQHDNVYWFNQYGNELVVEAYKETLGRETIGNMPDVDYIFLAVSSGGTVAGVSAAAKEYNPNIQIVAVDVEGSKIFNPQTKLIKHFTGIGSSIRTDNLKRAHIDDQIIVSEEESISGLFELLHKEQLFLGGTSGCVYAGARRYLMEHHIDDKKCVLISHDRGERYFSNMYQKHMDLCV